MKTLLGSVSLLVVALWVLAAIGWVMNIIDIFGVKDMTELCIRVVGVFVAPAGSLMGWFM